VLLALRRLKQGKSWFSSYAECRDHKIIPLGCWGTDNPDKNVIWAEFLPRSLIKNIRRQPRALFFWLFFAAL
jgi:hypothetical protein